MFLSQIAWKENASGICQTCCRRVNLKWHRKLCEFSMSKTWLKSGPLLVPESYCCTSSCLRWTTRFRAIPSISLTKSDIANAVVCHSDRGDINGAYHKSNYFSIGSLHLALIRNRIRNYIKSSPAICIATKVGCRSLFLLTVWVTWKIFQFVSYISHK